MRIRLIVLSLLILTGCTTNPERHSPASESIFLDKTSIYY